MTTDIAQAAAALARSGNTATLQTRLQKLSADTGEQARILLLAAEAHGINGNTGGLHRLLSANAEPQDASQVRALLLLGHTSERMIGPDWWLTEVNLHSPFGNLTGMVTQLGAEGAVLLESAESMEPFLRCGVEIALAAGGIITADQLSEQSRAAFLGLLLTMSFSDHLLPLGEAIWGEGLLKRLAEQTPSLPWRRLPDLDRFVPIWSDISAEAAGEMLCRGEWSSMPEAMAMMEQHPGPMRPTLLRCAERWLTTYGDTSVSFGGNGNLVNLIGLSRSGDVESRFHRLVDICSYRPADMPLINEAIQVLPMAEREERALQWPGRVHMLYAPHAPTPPVIAQLIQQIQGWKRNESGMDVRAAPRILAGWGAAAGPPLIAALDGSRAPFTPMLLGALGALKLPESAAVFDHYLDHSKTQEAAAAGLSELGASLAMPVIEEALFARKKDRRVGAAMALSRLPDDAARRDLAARRLTKERSAPVIALLTPLTT